MNTWSKRLTLLFFFGGEKSPLYFRDWQPGETVVVTVVVQSLGHV